MSRRLAILPGLLVAVALAGCGVSTRGAEQHVATVGRPAPAIGSPAVRRLARRGPGALIIAASTQGSLTPLAAQAYRSAGGSDTVSVQSTAAATAFSQLCRGQIDMVDSSSPIAGGELAQCERAGIRPVQLEVASDAVLLATKSETDVGADCLTVAQVRSIFRAGSPVYDWGQLGFDQVPLSVAGPSLSSPALQFVGRHVLGTAQRSLLDFRFDYHAQAADQGVRQFVTGSGSDAVAAAQLTGRQQRVSTLRAILTGARQTLTGANLAVGQAGYQVTKGIADQRPAATQQQDAAALAAARAKQKLARAEVSRLAAALASARNETASDRAAQRRLGADTGHLGLFRFSYYGLFEQFLRPLEITTSASPENCSFPSQQTVTSGAYPLSRQLLITTSVQDAGRADVRDFLLSYLHNAQRLAKRQGLVQLPDDVLSREAAYLGADGLSSAAGSSGQSVRGTVGSPATELPSTVH